MRYRTAAREMLTTFVRTNEVSFGLSEVILNVHLLIHITDNLEHRGLLDKFTVLLFDSFHSETHEQGPNACMTSDMHTFNSQHNRYRTYQ